MNTEFEEWDDLTINDKYGEWRETEIGYVWLAFAVLKEAIVDYFIGTADEHLSASLFFNGNPAISNLHIFLQVLKMSELPPFLTDYIYGNKTVESADVDEISRYLDEIEKQYKSGKVDYLLAKKKKAT